MKKVLLVLAVLIFVINLNTQAYSFYTANNSQTIDFNITSYASLHANELIFKGSSCNYEKDYERGINNTDTVFSNNEISIKTMQSDTLPNNIFVKKIWIDKGSYNLASDSTDLYSECGLGNEYLKVIFSNISQNDIESGQMQIWFTIDNLPVTNNQKDTIKFDINPNIDYNYTFRLPYNFSVTNQNRQFNVKAFSVLAVDQFKANDTAQCYILSKHQLPALQEQNIYINYLDSVNLSINSNDSIYWFLNAHDNIPILKSKNYQTQRLHSDTIFYFSRKQEIPLLKISEIQFTKTGNPDGLTSNLPAWVNQNCAIELTNLGDGAINIKNYKIEYILGASGDSLNSPITHTYTFPNYILPANSALVLQYANQVSPDSSKTLYIGDGTFFTNSKVGFLLKDTNNNVIDALAVNGVRFRTSHNVPANVWTGHGRTLPATSAGIIRNTTNAMDLVNWIPASTNKFMSIGILDSNLVIAYDNGCFGYKSPYYIHITGIPSIDPGVASIKLVGVNRTSACTLTDEQVEVKITNTGVSPCTSTPLLLKVYNGTTLINTIYDTCNITVASNNTITYIIPQTINLASNTSDKTFNIVCNANHSADVIHLNDTARMQITSLRTPYSPIASTVNIPYATRATLTANGVDPTDVLIWYNSNYTNHELDRITYTTPILYENDTFYVGSMLLEYDTIQLGDSNIANALTAYPSPFNGNVKNVKEQYLYKASELRNLGLAEGNINSIMFDILSASGIATLTDYSIKIGTTNEESLATWITGLTEVFNDTVRITNSSANYGWRNLQFADPFYYDGTSNLIIEICFTRQESDARNVSTKYSATSFNSVLSYRNASTNACLWTGSPTQMNLRLRPNTRFNVDKFGCSSVRTPVAVNVAPAPDCEAGLTQIVNPSTSIVMSGAPIPIQVRIKNYGTDTLVNPNIEWNVNGQLQTPYQYIGSISPNKDTVLTIGNKMFISGVNEIIAWTNIACDTVFNDNDTTSFAFFFCITFNDTINAEICQGEIYNQYGFFETSTGFYSQNLQTIKGCDSIVHLNLTVNPIYNDTIIAEICQGETYSLNGFNVNAAGFYTQNLQTTKGCDSIVNLNLTINQPTETNLSAVICEGEVYSLNGFNASTTGVHTLNLQTYKGCDSIVNLSLIVNPLYNDTIFTEICDGEAYSQFGFNESVTGFYTQSLQSIKGCDSIVNLSLIVNPLYNDTIIEEICSNETYSLNGFNVNAAGFYTQNLQSINGCDSIVNLSLIVNTASITTYYDTICKGNIYNGYGFSFTADTTGRYTQNMQTNNGCDSIIALNLTVKPIPLIPESLAVQVNSNFIEVSWQDNGSSYVIYRNNDSLTTTTMPIYLDYAVTNGQAYCYKVKSINEECESAFTNMICKTYVGLNYVQTDNIITRLYPNPTNNKSKLEIEGLTSEADVLVYDMIGRIMLKHKFNKGMNELEIDLSTYAKGVYSIRIVNESINQTKKLIVQ